MNYLRKTDKMWKDPDSEIKQFYSGTTVFLTGATGSLGKTILEKLLRSCDLKRIYILLRTKKGKCPAERLEELFNSKVNKQNTLNFLNIL